jgi:dynein heavy chain
MQASIDRFVFTFKASDFDATSANIEPLEDGVYVSGLFLEAASWDRKRRLIVDQQPNELTCAMPLIGFIPKESPDTKGNLYSCPLYKTMNRAGTLSTTGQSTNFILEVQLPCDKQSDFWVLRGVAMFTQLNV